MSKSKVNRGGKEYNVYVPTKEEELSDDMNPQYLYQNIHTSILVDIISGNIDTIEAAKRELNNRGLNEKGQWVGFNTSGK